MAAGGSVKLPLDLDLQSGTAYNDWKYWEAKFEVYLVSTGQDNVNDKKQVYSKVKEAFERYVSLRANEVIQHSVLNQRVQEEGETFEHFLTSLQETSIIMVPFYMGKAQNKRQVTMNVTKIKCCETESKKPFCALTIFIEKAATHCRVWEQSRQQVNLIHKNREESDSSVLVKAVKHRRGNSIAESEVK
ncbi:hypothetical protein PR048_013890 [Dryococelus australis]|uniref:Uncharacterized protein n=1 Tax=Dryococelus australis TaxID=614101 RepID=A0ABQ9HTE4_9NEOP|nr:hypothetical protein PR048_013890 [Dryococelus australis]